MILSRHVTHTVYIYPDRWLGSSSLILYIVYSHTMALHRDRSSLGSISYYFAFCLRALAVTTSTIKRFSLLSSMSILYCFHKNKLHKHICPETYFVVIVAKFGGFVSFSGVVTWSTVGHHTWALHLQIPEIPESPILSLFASLGYRTRNSLCIPFQIG